MAGVTLKGLYDIHIHSAPDLSERVGDDIEIATWCRDAGMAGVMFKCPHECTTARAYYASQRVENIEIYGGIVLNRFVGGINPLAVEAALQTGAKMVWMPTVDGSFDHAMKNRYTGPSDHEAGRARPGVVSLLDDSGRLIPQVHTVLELVARHGVALGTGHASPEEMDLLIPAAVEAGCKKITLTHVNFGENRVPFENVRKYVAMGALVEFVSTNVLGGYATLQESREWIEVLGADNCFLATDSGTPRKSLPHESMRVFLTCLEYLGVEARDLEVMARVNPEKLMKG